MSKEMKQSFFEKSRRNILNSYEKFKSNQNNTTYSTSIRPISSYETINDDKTLRENRSNNYQFESNQYFSESTTRPYKKSEFINENMKNQNSPDKLSVSNGKSEGFVYSKTYIEQLKMRFDNEKNEMERNYQQSIKGYERNKRKYEQKIEELEISKNELININKREIDEIEKRYDKYIESLKLEIKELQNNDEKNKIRIRELEEINIRCNQSLKESTHQNLYLEKIATEFKNKINEIENEYKKRNNAQVIEMNNTVSGLEKDKIKLIKGLEAKIEKLTKNIENLDEKSKVELISKQRQIEILENNNEELERTHNLIIQNLKRENQALNENLKNKKTSIENYIIEIKKLNETLDDLKKEKYLIQSQVKLKKKNFNV